MDVMLSSPLDKKNRPPRSFLHVKQSEKTNQSEDVGIPVGGHGGPFRLVLVGAVAAGVFPRLMSASPASPRDAGMRNHWTCPPGRMAGRESGKGAVLCRRARLNGLGGFPRETTDRRGSTWRSAAAVPRGPSVPLHCGVPVLWCSRTVVFWHDPPGDSRTPRTAIIDPSRSRHDPAWGRQSPAKSPLQKTSTQCVRPLGRTPSVPGRGPNGVGG